MNKTLLGQTNGSVRYMGPHFSTSVGSIMCKGGGKVNCQQVLI